MITLICLGISLMALLVALGEIENERLARDRHVAMWTARHGQIPEGLGGTPWTRRQAS